MNKVKAAELFLGESQNHGVILKKKSCPCFEYVLAHRQNL